MLNATNGGYVTVHNYDPGVDAPNSPTYLNGKKSSHHTALVMDFHNPEHCSVTDDVCTDEMLAIRETYTQNVSMSTHNNRLKR